MKLDDQSPRWRVNCALLLGTATWRCIRNCLRSRGFALTSPSFPNVPTWRFSAAEHLSSNSPVQTGSGATNTRASVSSALGPGSLNAIQTTITRLSLLSPLSSVGRRDFTSSQSGRAPKAAWPQGQYLGPTPPSRRAVHGIPASRPKRDCRRFQQQRHLGQARCRGQPLRANCSAWRTGLESAYHTFTGSAPGRELHPTIFWTGISRIPTTSTIASFPRAGNLKFDG